MDDKKTKFVGTMATTREELSAEIKVLARRIADEKDPEIKKGLINESNDLSYKGTEILLEECFGDRFRQMKKRTSPQTSAQAQPERA